MVERRHDFAPHQGIQHPDLHRLSRRRVERSAHADIHDIIVAVTMRIITLAVQFAVLVLAQLFGMQTVRCREFVASCYTEHAVSPK